MITATNTFSDPPLRSGALVSRALDLLQEADHLLNQRLLDPIADAGPLTGIEGLLTTARQILGRQPGTAMALSTDALNRLMATSAGTTSPPPDRASGLGQSVVDAPRLIQPYSAPSWPDSDDAPVPVSIYLESTTHAAVVEQAVLDVLYASGFVIEAATPAVTGSWFRVMSTRLKGRGHASDVLARIERALEIQALHRPQAEVDSAQADAVAKLITALSQDQNAFIQIGSVFLIKVDGVTVVRNLTQQELTYLQRNSRLLVSPGKSFRPWMTSRPAKTTTTTPNPRCQKTKSSAS